MKVFISWSGERSRVVALSLKTWLPTVIQVAEPWVSEVDIEKGAPWFDAIRQAIAESAVGIIILTPENVNSPWINFEAGGMSQLLQDRRACPLVIGMAKADVPSPLGQLNSTSAADREDMLNLLRTVRPPSISLSAMEHAFDREWHSLEVQLVSIASEPPPEGVETTRPESEKIDEILSTLRSIQRPAASDTGRSRRSAAAAAALDTLGNLLIDLGAEQWATSIDEEEGIINLNEVSPAFRSITTVEDRNRMRSALREHGYRLEIDGFKRLTRKPGDREV